MEPDEMRDQMQRALEDRLVPSPGLEARVLAVLPQAPARPGSRIGRPGWPARPAGLIAALLCVTVVGAFVFWRTGTLPGLLGLPPVGESALTLGQFTPAGSGWVIVRQIPERTGPVPATIFRTDDAGTTWRQQLTLHSEDPQLRASPDGNRAVVWGIDRSNPSCNVPIDGGFRCSAPPAQVLHVYRTADGGQHWTAMNPFPDVQEAFFLDPDHGWLQAGSELPNPSGSHGGYRTLDGGRTWSPAGAIDIQSTPAIAGGWGGTSESFAFDDPDTGWFTTSGSSATAAHAGVFATHDGGLSWSELVLPPLPGLDAANRLMVDRPVTFADGTGVLLVTDRATGQPFVYTTSDRGVHWVSPRPLFPPGSAQAGERIRGETVIAQFLPGGVWFVMNQTQQGAGAPGSPPARLFTTADGGLHWTTRAPAPVIFHLDMVTARDGWAEAAEGPRNTNVILRTTDGGAHWTQVSAPAAPRRPAFASSAPAGSGESAAP